MGFQNVAADFLDLDTSVTCLDTVVGDGTEPYRVVKIFLLNRHFRLRTEEGNSEKKVSSLKQKITVGRYFERVLSIE